MGFTFFSLIVVSSTTKSDSANNLTAKMTAPVMVSDQENDYEKIQPVQNHKGEVVSQEEMHAFPISVATIVF